MNLQPIAEYLERLGVGTQGTDLFVGMFPAESSLGVMLRPPLIGVKFDHDLPGYMKFTFQVIARANNYEAGQELARRVLLALNLGNSDAIAGWTVNYMRPGNIPVGFPISPGELVEFNTVFEVCAVVPEWALR